MKKNQFEGSSIADVIAALGKGNKNPITSGLEENTALLSSIQNLQERSANRIDDVAGMFGNGRTSVSLRNSLIGKFVSTEMKKQLSSLNDRGYGPTNTSFSGGRSGKGAGGNTGSLFSNLVSLFKMKFPSLFGGAMAGAAIGGAASLGSSSSNVMNGSDANNARYPAGDSKRYEDLSVFKDRGSRNVNPGNVKGSSYLGQVGQDEKGHAKFATKEAGVAGIVDRLYRYNKDQVKGDGLSGKKTIREIMNIYAPASDNNNTERYIADISRQLGIRADQQIDFKNNPELLKPFVQAIMRNESPGVRAYSDEEINKGIEIGRDSALLGKEASRDRHVAYLEPSNTPTRRAASGYVADSLSGDQKGLNNNLFDETKDHVGTKYRLGGKNADSGAIDCSGWVQTAMKKAGAPQNVIDQVTGKDAANQVMGTGRSTNTLRATNDITGSGLKEGQLIGVKNNAGKMGGIGHVGIVVRNPETGELGVSHSSSSKGVNWQPIASFQRDFGRHGFVTSDPLAASREIEKEDKAKQTEEDRTKQVAEGTKASPEIASALTGNTPEAETTTVAASNPNSQSEPAKPLGVEVANNTSSASGSSPKSSDTGEKELSFYDYLTKVENKRLTREMDYGLGITGLEEAEDRYAAYQASNKAKKEEGSLAASKSNKEANTEQVLASTFDSAKAKSASNIKPVVSPINKNKGSEKPIETAAATQPVSIQPVIVNSPQQGKSEGSVNAGGSLPMKVDSQAVLAFQLDPSTPVHA